MRRVLFVWLIASASVLAVAGAGVGQYGAIAESPGIVNGICASRAEVLFIAVVSHHQLPRSSESAQSRVAPVDIVEDGGVSFQKICVDSDQRYLNRTNSFHSSTVHREAHRLRKFQHAKVLEVSHAS